MCHWTIWTFTTLSFSEGQVDYSTCPVFFETHMNCLNTFPVQRIHGLCNPQVSSRWLDIWTEKIRATACLFQRQSQRYVLLEASAFDSAILTQRDQPDVWILTTKCRWTNCPMLPNTLWIQDSSCANNRFHHLQKEDFFSLRKQPFCTFFCYAHVNHAVFSVGDVTFK